jgi:pimeloyl-ACP methyl ester carboxylesterase
MFPIPKATYQTLDESFVLASKDGKKITLVHLNNPDAYYTVLYSHGNGEDLGTIMPILKAFQANGFSILAYDYHGYGMSEGVPSEENAYLDIRLAYDYLVQNLKRTGHQIILYGRSIGSGPSIDLAIKAPIAGLILENPFISAFRVVTGIPLFPLDRFRNNSKIEKVTVPILIMHSMDDRVVPIWQGKYLYELIKTPKYFFAVPKAGHNDMIPIAGKDYWNNIQSFSESLK